MNMSKILILLMFFSVAPLGSCNSSRSSMLGGTTDGKDKISPLQSLFDQHPEFGRHVVQQTLRLFVRSPEIDGPGYYSTGFVVSDTQLVTSAHFLTYFIQVDATGTAYPKAKELEILFINPENKPIHRIEVNLPDFIKNTDPLASFDSAMPISQIGSENVNRFSEVDVAVIELKRRTFSNIIGKYIYPFPIEFAPPHYGSEIFSLGYGKGDQYLRLRATGFRADENFSMMSRNGESSLYLRSVASGEEVTRPGDSGGPLFFTDKDGKLRLIGLNTAGRKLKDKYQDLFTSFRNSEVTRLLNRNNIPIDFTEDLNCFSQ